jgi:hypothetical protein
MRLTVQWAGGITVGGVVETAAGDLLYVESIGDVKEGRGPRRAWLKGRVGLVEHEPLLRGGGHADALVVRVVRFDTRSALLTVDLHSVRRAVNVSHRCTEAASRCKFSQQFASMRVEGEVHTSNSKKCVVLTCVPESNLAFDVNDFSYGSFKPPSS